VYADDNHCTVVQEDPFYCQRQTKWVTTHERLADPTPCFFFYSFVLAIVSLSVLSNHAQGPLQRLRPRLSSFLVAAAVTPRPARESWPRLTPRLSARSAPRGTYSLPRRPCHPLATRPARRAPCWTWSCCLCQGVSNQVSVSCACVPVGACVPCTS